MALFTEMNTPGVGGMAQDQRIAGRRMSTTAELAARANLGGSPPPERTAGGGVAAPSMASGSMTTAMRKKRRRGPLAPGQVGGSTSGTALNAQGSSLFTGNIGATTQNSLFVA